VCSKIGFAFIHSIAVVVFVVLMVLRVEMTPSHKIHMNSITDKKETKDPSEDAMFQDVKASG